jgi:hypothetical protein
MYGRIAHLSLSTLNFHKRIDMILSNRMCLVKFGLLLQTFRPKKRFEPGTLRYSLHKQAQASLSSGINLRSVVHLPQGEDPSDWIAVHGKLTVLKSEDKQVSCLESENFLNTFLFYM